MCSLLSFSYIKKTRIIFSNNLVIEIKLYCKLTNRLVTSLLLIIKYVDTNKYFKILSSVKVFHSYIRVKVNLHVLMRYVFFTLHRSAFKSMSLSCMRNILSYLFPQAIYNLPFKLEP